jgi:hypothetical protein
MSSASEVARYMRVLEARGLEVTRARRGGHWMVRSSCGVVFVACTPSDYRWLANTEAKLRRLQKAQP